MENVNNLADGAHIIVLVEQGNADKISFMGRMAGLTLRDTFLIVWPGLQISLALLLRKKIGGSVLDVIIENSTGGLNIAGCRANSSGRWPSNLALVHDPQCEGDTCTQGCPVGVLNSQSEYTKSSDDPLRFQGTVKFKNKHYVREGKAGLASAALKNDLATAYGDEGYASRYFPCFRSGEELFEWFRDLVGDRSLFTLV